MAYEKIYEEVGWADKPNTKTPLSSDNLNKMDEAINELDNRIVSIDASIGFETGTWTPVNGVQSTALTDYFDINNASFTKIGNIIMASFTMSLKLAYDAAPSATIYLGAHSGLPYPIKGFITGYCNNSYIMTSEPAHVLYEASPPSFVLKPDVAGNDQGSGADPNRNNRVYLVYEIKS